MSEHMLSAEEIESLKVGAKVQYCAGDQSSFIEGKVTVIRHLNDEEKTVNLLDVALPAVLVEMLYDDVSILGPEAKAEHFPGVIEDKLHSIILYATVGELSGPVITTE